MHQIHIDGFTYNELHNLNEGHYSPVSRFMGHNEVQSVLSEMVLESGKPWSMPIILSVPQELHSQMKEGEELSLEYQGEKAARIRVEEKFTLDHKDFNKKLFGTEDQNHPGIGMNMRRNSGFYISGPFISVSEPKNAMPVPKPEELKQEFKRRGWKTVAAFQTRNIPHIGHEYAQKYALKFTDGLLINPILGEKKKGDFKDEVIRSTYDVLLKKYHDPQRAMLSFLRLNILYSGPREAVFHSLVRRNLGCTHFIVGRDHAGVGDYYKPYEAQELLETLPDLGIEIIPIKEVLFCNKCGVVQSTECPHGEAEQTRFKGTNIRKVLTEGGTTQDIRPEVLEEVRKVSNPFVE